MKLALIAAASLSLAAAITPAEAAPVDLDTNAGHIVLVYGGCGPFGHRGPYGGCRPGGQWGGYVPGAACPPGWHLGPYGQHCWRNFY